MMKELLSYKEFVKMEHTVYGFTSTFRYKMQNEIIVDSNVKQSFFYFILLITKKLIYN